MQEWFKSNGRVENFLRLEKPVNRESFQNRASLYGAFRYEKWSEHRTTFTYGSYEPNLRDASRKIFKRGSSWSRVNINYFEPFQAGKRNFYLLWDGSPREDGLGLFRSPIGFFLLLFHLFLLLLFFNSFERSVSYRSCSILNGGGKLKIDLEKFRLE